MFLTQPRHPPAAPGSLLDRARGAYLGFAIGDALGATVEFLTPREIQAQYGVHEHIVGGGWLRLKPGQITDDTQMSLALGDAILEASFAGIELVVAITEGVPVKDMIRLMPVLRQNGTRLVGPNCPGLITPEECLIGILPGNIFSRGNVGLMSRSGTLTYEVVNLLTESNMGQTTCIGIGGDPVAGLYYRELLDLFEQDPQTEGVVLIGEIGGDAEEQAARFIKEKMTKPVVAFIAGQTAPPGKRMGHAGAIISSGSGTAEEKIRAFAEAGDQPGRLRPECRPAKPGLGSARGGQRPAHRGRHQGPGKGG